jgi:uncharacterized membrane protein
MYFTGPPGWSSVVGTTIGGCRDPTGHQSSTIHCRPSIGSRPRAGPLGGADPGASRSDPAICRGRRFLEVTRLPGEEHTPEARRSVGTTRLEAFSDGVFAIAITLLVLDLAISESGPALDRVLDGWPFYLAYVVSFLTIGAAWLAHTGITDRLVRADLGLLRINLILLLVVALLPFPTRLVAEGLDDVSGERVFVAMYGIVLLGIRVLLYALDVYARRKHLLARETLEEADTVGQTIVPIAAIYGLAIVVGIALPGLAVALYCAIAVLLVFPFSELTRLFLRRA